VEKYQEGCWVEQFFCGLLRNAIAGQLRKISCGWVTHLLNCPLSLVIMAKGKCTSWGGVGVSSKPPARGKGSGPDMAVPLVKPNNKYWLNKLIY
jgi:hypothetical protein